MISADAILTNTYYAAAYAGVGVLLMLISFAVIDALTPGNLRHQLWIDRNRNAGILVGSNLIAVAIIVTAAIAAVTMIATAIRLEPTRIPALRFRSIHS